MGGTKWDSVRRDEATEERPAPLHGGAHLSVRWKPLVGVAILAGLLATALFLGVQPGWDTAVAMWVQRAAPLLDWPAALLVFLGNAEIMISAAVLSGLLWFHRDRRRGLAGLWLTVGLVGASVIAVLLKLVLNHPGPPPSLQRHVLDVGVHYQTPFSFPSGHTMRTTVLAGIAFRRVPILAGATVLAMMAALVYLGDHWMSDVLGGLCLGWACVVALRAVGER